MTEIKDTYNKLNDVEIESIKLTSDQGGSVDIHEDMVKTVSIYEDVFSPCLSKNKKNNEFYYIFFAFLF